MNLLLDPLFRVETPDGLIRLDLPGLLASLGQDQVETLSGLQRHQEDAVHIFLCYLAGAVLAREGLEEPRQTAEFWRTGIRKLTQANGCENDNAWTLVVDDPTQPAFMQPPCPTVTAFKAYKLKATTPDALDVLITAKNHDIKSNRAIHATPEAWVYALISLQTMSGFLGQGNYGIARMNGGFGSRPVVALEYQRGVAARWREQTARLVTLRSELLEYACGYEAAGLVLTWLSTWDLSSSLSLNTLDPFFIEVARPIRLITANNGELAALSVSSKSCRIAANTSSGVLGDPWTPINIKDKKKGQSSLTVSAAGFAPELLRNLIFEQGFSLTPMQKPDPRRTKEACWFTASVLVRGQGTTDGFHQVALPIPATVTSKAFMLFASPVRDTLAERSKTALNDNSVMLNKVLKPAILSLLQAGPETINFDKREVGAWWETTRQEFIAAWSPEFFPWLWRHIDTEDNNVARLEWLKLLQAKAKTTFNAAITRYPYRTGRRYRSIVRAENIFFGAMFNTFQQLKVISHEPTGNSVESIDATVTHLEL